MPSVRAAMAGWMAVVALIVTPRVARADEAAVPAAGTYEVGLQTAYGFGVTSNAQMITFLPRLTRVLVVTDLVPIPRMHVPGVVTFGIEGLFTRVLESSHAMELGGGLLMRYRILLPHVEPYAELGGAMLYSDLRHFSLGSRILFAVQPAAGLEIPLGGGWSVGGGYRFRHISNGGQSRINPGLNANLFAIGISRRF